MPNHVWLIGASDMAAEYTKVLNEIGCEISVIGRGDASADAFQKKTGMPVFRGGVDRFLAENRGLPSSAIIAVSVDQLASAGSALIHRGVGKILIEKPAGLNRREIVQMRDEAIARNARVYVAYNRRFYSSTLAAREIIARDGGVSSFNFEFTEWNHVIEKLGTPAEIKQRWFLANSTHVVDLAFFLGGKPDKLVSFTSGSLPWHPAGSVFCGAGISKSGALFSYQANWDAPGRWGVEILTRQHRLIFRPMEQLHVQNRNSVAIEEVMIKNELDIKFKPGLYLQVKHFIADDSAGLCTLQEQCDSLEFYQRIARYPL